MINPDEEEDREIMYHHGLIDEVNPKKLTRLTIIMCVLFVVIVIMSECKF